MSSFSNSTATRVQSSGSFGGPQGALHAALLMPLLNAIEVCLHGDELLHWKIPIRRLTRPGSQWVPVQPPKNMSKHGAPSCSASMPNRGNCSLLSTILGSKHGSGREMVFRAPCTLVHILQKAAPWEDGEHHYTYGR